MYNLTLTGSVMPSTGWGTFTSSSLSELFILEDKILVQCSLEIFEACPHDFFCFFLDYLLVILCWENEILWDLDIPYVILLTFGNPPWVIIFPNSLPVLNRDVVPYKCPDDSLVFGGSFFRCEWLTDLVKLSDVPMCIPTSRKLWHTLLSFGLAATRST